MTDMQSLELKQHVLDRFFEHGDWPTYRDVEADFIDVVHLPDLLDEHGEDLLWEGPITDESRIMLSLEGVASCPAGNEIVEDFLAAARLAGQRYLALRSEARLTIEDLREDLGLPVERARRVARLLWDLGGQITSGGSRSNDDQAFTFIISPRAMQFRSVQTVPEYRTAVARARGIEDRENEYFREGLKGGRSGTAFDLAGTGSDQALPASLLHNLHPAVAGPAERFLKIGANAEAVRISLQVFEAFIQHLTGDSERSGRDLMAHTFRPENPRIRMNSLESVQDHNEQEGMKFLTMGAMVGIRNRYSHGAPRDLTRDSAVEQLAFVSFLFRCVEEATGILAVECGVVGSLGSDAG